MIVYCATNKINNKVYIGQTVQTLKKRKAQHLSDAKKGSEICVHRAIRKYGAENFTWGIIYRTDNLQDLNAAEEYLIAEYRSRAKGYNVKLGGGNYTGHAHSDKTRAQMSGSHKGKRHSAAQCKNIGDSLTGQKHPGYDHRIYAFYHAGYGIVACTQYDLRTTYLLNQSHIGELINGKQKSHKGWRMAASLN